jgi:hypothetical protein
MSVKYSNWLDNTSTFSDLMPSKIYPNWDFWFENKPSGNLAREHVGREIEQSRAKGCQFFSRNKWISSSSASSHIMKCATGRFLWNLIEQGLRSIHSIFLSRVGREKKSDSVFLSVSGHSKNQDAGIVATAFIHFKRSIKVSDSCHSNNSF